MPKTKKTKSVWIGGKEYSNALEAAEAAQRGLMESEASLSAWLLAVEDDSVENAQHLANEIYDLKKRVEELEKSSKKSKKEEESA